MRYEKPVAMELTARPVRGQEPELCFPGSAAQGFSWEMCVGGTVANNFDVCNAGSVVYPPCMTGVAPGEYLDCYSGIDAAFYCEAGSAGTNDPTGCHTGPSVTI